MFDIDWAQVFSGLSPELAVLLISTLPIAELRAAIPVGLTVFDLSVVTTFVYAVIGNMIPVVILVWGLNSGSRWLMKRFYFFNRFFTWLFERTRRQHSRKFEKYGALALISFVAIPLPITGGWTGSVAAFVFGIPPKKSLPLISIGVVIAGLIMTIITLGVSNIF